VLKPMHNGHDGAWPSKGLDVNEAFSGQQAVGVAATINHSVTTVASVRIECLTLVLERLAGSRIPDARGVIPGSSDDSGAIWAEVGRADRTLVSERLTDGLAESRIPDTRGGERASFT
jgi:hypothetical protein